MIIDIDGDPDKTIRQIQVEMINNQSKLVGYSEVINMIPRNELKKS